MSESYTSRRDDVRSKTAELLQEAFELEERTRSTASQIGRAEDDVRFRSTQKYFGMRPTMWESLGGIRAKFARGKFDRAWAKLDELEARVRAAIAAGEVLHPSEWEELVKAEQKPWLLLSTGWARRLIEAYK